MGDITGVSNKVMTQMQDLELRFSVDGKSDFSLRFGSVAMMVHVWSPKPDQADSPTFVRFTIPLLLGVNGSVELYKHIAFHADDFVFGHLSLFTTDRGELRIFFTHELLGDYLDAEEFNRVLFGMVDSADRLDDELKAKFGGRRFYED